MKHLATLAAAGLVLLGALATTASAQASGPGAEQFVLSGVVALDGGEGKAWLQEPRLTQNKVVVVSRGDRVGPWTVTRILSNRVELEGPGGKIFVPLQGTGEPAVAAPAPAPTAPVAKAAEPPAPPASNENYYPVGDPRRRQNIGKLFGILKPGESTLPVGTKAASPAPGIAAETKATSPAPSVAPQTSSSASSDKKRPAPVANTRGRQAIQQLFGPR